MTRGPDEPCRRPIFRPPPPDKATRDRAETVKPTVSAPPCPVEHDRLLLRRRSDVSKQKESKIKQSSYIGRGISASTDCRPLSSAAPKVLSHILPIFRGSPRRAPAVFLSNSCGISYTTRTSLSCDSCTTTPRHFRIGAPLAPINDVSIRAEMSPTRAVAFMTTPSKHPAQFGFAPRARAEV